MAIQFDCPFCTSTLKVPDSTAGKQGDCPRCGTKLVIPNPFAAEGGTPSADPAAAPDSAVSPSQDTPTPPPASQTPEPSPVMPPVNVVAPQPRSSATAQYLRKRRKSNAGGVILFLFFFAVMVGVAGYFYWNFGLRLEGNLVAARISSEAAKVEQRLNPANAGVSEEVIKAVNQNLLETPRRVQSDLMDVLFYGLEKGGLEVRLKPGAKTELVRVDLTGDPALMDYISKQGRTTRSTTYCRTAEFVEEILHRLECIFADTKRDARSAALPEYRLSEFNAGWIRLLHGSSRE